MNRRGPKPGETRRFEAKNRKLFAQLESLMAGGESLRGATRILGQEGKIAGWGTWESRAKGLERQYKREHEHPPVLSVSAVATGAALAAGKAVAEVSAAIRGTSVNATATGATLTAATGQIGSGRGKRQP
jgi:hypothetical protein